MDTAATTVALLLADARLPSGAHAFSAGVEPALQGGMPPHEIGAFLRARALTTTLVDAATAVVARRVALSGASYRAVEQAWAARTPSGAARTASRDVGRGLHRLALRIWPDSPPITAATADLGRWPARPVVLGAIAAVAGIDAETLIRVAVYDDMAGGVAALLKLEPGDPVDGVRLMLDSCAAVEPFVPLLATLVSPESIPAASAPHAEAWTEAHALSRRRLFRA